jgi:hypothetical protein
VNTVHSIRLQRSSTYQLFNDHRSLVRTVAGADNAIGGDPVTDDRSLLTIGIPLN